MYRFSHEVSLSNQPKQRIISTSAWEKERFPRSRLSHWSKSTILAGQLLPLAIHTEQHVVYFLDVFQKFSVAHLFWFYTEPNRSRSLNSRFKPRAFFVTFVVDFKPYFGELPSPPPRDATKFCVSPKPHPLFKISHSATRLANVKDLRLETRRNDCFYTCSSNLK